MNFEEYYDKRQSALSRQIFATASLSFGIMAMALCCTGIFSLPTGALSILFWVLSSREGEQSNTAATAGMALGILGICLGILLLILALYALYTDPAVMKQYNQIFEQIYGSQTQITGGTL